MACCFFGCTCGCQDLEGIDGLVLPGGESTTIGKLLRKMEMLEKVQQMARDG